MRYCLHEGKGVRHRRRKPKGGGGGGGGEGRAAGGGRGTRMRVETPLGGNGREIKRGKKGSRARKRSLQQRERKEPHILGNNVSREKGNAVGPLEGLRKRKGGKLKGVRLRLKMRTSRRRPGEFWRRGGGGVEKD